MKNALVYLMCLLAIFSCSRHSLEIDRNGSSITDKEEAMKSFSIALSKAVHSNQELKDFIKNEALKCFDNDYDVFYPYVKNCQIGDFGTFKDIIASHMDDPSLIDKIETIIPLLTIYVADVTWLDPDGFCARNWNTSESITTITYVGKSGVCRHLFSNGYFVGDIDAYTIPAGPVLIVKECERVTVNPSTKSGEINYRFIDSAFDGTITKDNTFTGPYSSNYISGEDAEDNTDKISSTYLNSLCPDTAFAFFEFANDPYALQNDYIFYGMSKSSTEGRLKSNVRTKIARFKISPRSFDKIFDDTNGLDKNFTDSFWETDKNGNTEPSTSEIYSKLWSDGALEICVKILSEGATDNIGQFYYDVKARDLYTLNENSILRERWGSNLVKWYVTWKYSIPSRDTNTLTSKWYYPENSPNLPTWDLYNNSAYTIFVSEEDSGTTTTRTISYTSKKVNQSSQKVGLDVGLSDNVTLKTELGWSQTDEAASSSSESISWTNNNDILFQQIVSYKDDYIYQRLTPAYFNVHSYESDRFTFTILPVRY